MKRIAILLIALSILCQPVFAQEEKNSPWSLYTELDMYVGLKAGVKYQLNDKLDYIATFGINLIEWTQYCYSTFVSYHTMPNYKNFKIDINMGIIQGVFDYTSEEYDDYIYVNPGITMHVSYAIHKNIRIGAQAGMVLMIGYDQEILGSSLEPYIGLTFTFF